MKAKRERARRQPLAVSLAIEHEVGRLQALADRTRDADHPDAVWIATMIERIASKLSEAAAQLSPSELFPGD